MNDLTLEIRGLEKSFPQFKLGPLDLNVPKGAIYGLIGPNGAGKTTTIDLILGMGREDAGTIRVFGLDHRAQEVEVKRRIGYVSPDLNYDAWKWVSRLIHFIRKFYSDWDDTYCRELMEKLSVGWDDRISTLSFGMRIRLALIVALSHRPALLLLDEPIIGLDAVSKRDIFAELLAAVQDENRTVLIASNTLSDIERFADHVGMIKNGRLLLEGPTAEIVDRYRMVDCLFADGSALPKMQGFFVQERSEGRLRALVDTTGGAMRWLQDKGAMNISAEPSAACHNLGIAYRDLVAA